MSWLRRVQIVAPEIRVDVALGKDSRKILLLVYLCEIISENGGIYRNMAECYPVFAAAATTIFSFNYGQADAI